MGRLFWKFFLLIALAQILAVAAIGTIMWLTEPQRQAGSLDRSPPAMMMLDAAAGILQHAGPAALREWLASPAHPPVWVLDAHGNDLLGRPLPASHAAATADTAGSQAVRQVAIAGQRYTLFMLRPDGSPGGAPPPRPGGPFPLLPLATVLLASLLCAALLAAYVARPVRQLRNGFRELRHGNLGARLAPQILQRHDELAELATEFNQTAERLRQLLEGQQRLLHDVSHELRSPLARLQAAIGLARQQPERLEASLQRIELESQRIDALVGELLTLSRLDAGARGMRETVDLVELLADIVEDARFESRERGLVLHLAAPEECGIEAEAPLLHRALENIVRNAIRHAPADGQVSIDVATEENDSHIQISDNGPGVPEAELPLLFAPFYRASNAATPGGHGLGLALARRIIIAHGGTISASNRAGGGLVVSIRLPRRHANSGETQH